MNTNENNAQTHKEIIEALWDIYLTLEELASTTARTEAIKLHKAKGALDKVLVELQARDVAAGTCDHPSSAGPG